MSSRDYFREQLVRQFGFVEASCNGFDSGHIDEAIRIATSLRVIFHLTSNSTSLLHHLNATTVNLLSTCPKRESDNPNGFWPGFLQLKLTIDPPSVACHPNLDALSWTHKRVVFSYWWDSETVFFANRRRFKRKQIILNAANKDGGAHVDAELPADYRTLIEGSGMIKFGVKPVGEKEIEFHTQHAHLASLRQIAHEVLNSRELLALAG